ncbi:hypothetical protein C450_05040 [Halococcus salifodinae DSM 8989]|uniref:Uncharacterized protein n=1 Tax=Halococcus salifodinae DSM 8989 TaxID=1227456 RepID=M0N9K3_9EURY|nr:hypothetical protein C450_05040 [Halococcus salifodinae DSM 8989]
MTETELLGLSAQINRHERSFIGGLQLSSVEGVAMIDNSISDIETSERFHSVGSDTDTRPDGPKFLGCFVHYRVKTTVQQTDGRTQTTDAAANDCDIGHLLRRIHSEAT